MKAWISGVSGFIGSHLARHLVEKGVEVAGIYFFEEELHRLDDIKDRIKLSKVDIRDPVAVQESIVNCSPSRIYHLAAQSFPTVSWDKPSLTLETNAIGTVNVFETVKKHGLECRILVACSSAEYGFVTPEEVPVDEEHHLRPLHPYGVSKVAQDFLAYQYFKNFDMDTVRVRIFNTTGPSKTLDVASDFSKQVVQIEKGLIENRLSHGNLESERDITDVRDMVEAFEALMERGTKGEVYNACSSKVVKIQYVLDTLVGLAKTEINVFQDPDKMRPSDEPIIMGDNSRLSKDTGWEPKISIDRTLEDMLEYWREKL
jgi:GDP-4-dehydro-6-deoxy-D-mannose reductase